MASENEIIVSIKAELTDIKKSLEDFKNESKKAGESAGDNIAGALTKRFIAAFAITKTIGAVKDLFEESIKEAAAAGKAVNLLASSLAAAGNYSKQAVSSFEEFAKGLQKTTTFSDDLIVSNATVLASLGRLSGEGLERATKAALDLAATGRVSLEGSFDAIAKAAARSEGALGRYGIKIDDSIPKSERFAAILSQLEGRFSGLAASQVNTYSGAIEQLGNNFRDVLETIGKAVTESPQVVAFIKELSRQFAILSQSLSGAAGKNFVSGLVNDLLQVGQVIVNWVIRPLEQLYNIGKVVFFALRGGVQALLTVIGFIPAYLTEISGKFIQFSSGIGKLVGVFNEDLGNRITENIKTFGQGAEQMGANVRTTLTENLDLFSQDTATALKDSFLTPTSDAFAQFVGNFQTAVANAQDISTGFKNSTVQTVTEVSDSLKRAQADIQQAFQQGVLRTISTSIQAIGASLVRGGAAFNDFKKVILGIIGDIAIQIGTTLVGIGIGIDSLKTALGTLSGGVAIAAGFALIALGGALKALSGGSGLEGAGAVGGGNFGGGAVAGGAAAGGPETLIGTQQGTAVNVNVNGNILDRRESGLEIASVIQEYFNTNGNIVAGAT